MSPVPLHRKRLHFIRAFPSRMVRRLSAEYRHFQNALKRFEDDRYTHNHIDLSARIGNTFFEGDVTLAEGVRLSGTVSIGKYTTVDRFSIIHGGEIRIGRYTQIGSNVGIYAINHGIDYISIYNNQHLFNGRLKQLSEKEVVEIGNDVWIGFGAVILPGVKIGNGAVIGAGAVVTQDISDYGIAVGNPARVVRKRLSDDVIAILTNWAWWQLEPEALIKYESLFTLNLNMDSQVTIDQLVSHLTHINE